MDSKSVLVVGYGGSGKRFADNMVELGEGCKVDVLNTSKTKTQRSIEQYDIYNDMNQMQGKKYDMIIIAVPTSEHINYLEKLLDASDFFILEKPIDADFQRIERLLYKLNNSKKRVFVYFQKRFLSSWTKAKEIIESGVLGKFQYGKVDVQSNLKQWRDKNYLQLYATQKSLGGGATLTECHEIDAINWLIGDISEVSGVKGFAHEEIDVEDSVHYIAKIDGKPVTFNIDMLCDKVSNQIELKYKNGWLTIDTIANQLSCNICGDEKVYAYAKEDCNKLAAKAFLKLVFEGKNDSRFVNFYQAMKVNAVCEALNVENKKQTFRSVRLSVFPEEGEEVIRYVVNRTKEVFADKIIAIYGMGSLGYGGYVNGWSDLDIDIILDVSYKDAKAMFYKGKEIEKEIQKNGYERIDIRAYNHVHLNERKTILSFGQCSRAVMLIDSSQLIYGTDISNQIIRPSVQEMNKEAWSLCKSFFDKDEEYWDNLPWDDMAAFYALIARFVYSAKTGKVGGKRVAMEYFIEHYLEQFPMECRVWFIWAYALRLDAYAKNILLKACVREMAVHALRESFNVVYEILSKEIDCND